MPAEGLCPIRRSAIIVKRSETFSARKRISTLRLGSRYTGDSMLSLCITILGPYCLAQLTSRSHWLTGLIYLKPKNSYKNVIEISIHNTPGSVAAFAPLTKTARQFTPY